MEKLEHYLQSEEEVLGGEHTPFIPEENQENENGNDSDSLPKSLRTIVLGLGVLLGTYIAADKSMEYYSLHENQGQTNKELLKLDSLEHKIIRIKELFGDNADLSRYEVLKINLFERKNAEERALANFSLFEDNEIKIEKNLALADAEDSNHLVPADSIQFSTMSYGRPLLRKADGPFFQEPERIIRKVSYAEFMTLLTEKVFPQGAIKGEVKCIIQTNREGEIRPDYYNNEVPRGVYTVADCSTHLLNENVITLYKPMSEMDIREFMETIAHEVGHANDWNTDNALSIEERADLLLAVANRVRSKDRFISGYPESIENNDKKLELYNKCTEYWAEIYATYILFPTRLNYADFKIVDSFVKKSDPAFEPHIFSDQRDNFMNIIRTLDHEN